MLFASCCLFVARTALFVDCCKLLGVNCLVLEMCRCALRVVGCLFFDVAYCLVVVFV